MSNSESNPYEPFKIQMGQGHVKEPFTVNFRPDGERTKMEIDTDINRFSDRALRWLITSTLETLREQDNNHKLYYKLPKLLAGGAIATALHGNGFEIYESTDDYDYYSPLAHLSKKEVSELGEVDFAPELVDSIKKIIECSEDISQLKKEEFNLLYHEFDRFTVDIKQYHEDKKLCYSLTIKQKHRSESVFRTRYPTEVVEVHLAAQTGKVIGYKKSLEHLDEDNEPIPLTNRAEVGFVLNPDDEQFIIIDEEDVPELHEAVCFGLTVEQLDEIQSYMNKLLVEYTVD